MLNICLYFRTYFIRIMSNMDAYGCARETNGLKKSSGLKRYSNISNTFGVLRPLLAPLN